MMGMLQMMMVVHQLVFLKEEVGWLGIVLGRGMELKLSIPLIFL